VKIDRTKTKPFNIVARITTLFFLETLDGRVILNESQMKQHQLRSIGHIRRMPSDHCSKITLEEMIDNEKKKII
jgi:repressor of nif and glnA expression